MPEPHLRTARFVALVAVSTVAFVCTLQGVAHAYVRADVTAPTSLPPPIVIPSAAPGPILVSPLSRLSAPELAPNVLMAWAAQGLPAGFSGSAERSDGVRLAVVVAQDTLWMTRSFDADGKTVDHPPRPYAIPIDTAAADPGELSQVVKGLPSSIVHALDDGQGILGASSARLRGIGAGGALQFDGRRVHIAAVVPDQVIGHSELLVSTHEGARLGVLTRRYAIVRPAADSSRARVASELERIVHTPTPLQIRTPRATPYPAQGDLTLPPVRLKEEFGEFDARPDPRSPGLLKIDPRWMKHHIKYRTLPLVGNIQCNKALYPQLLGAIHELQRRGLGGLIHTENGCFVAKYVEDSPTAAISKHAWGAAVDLNIDGNRFGETPHQDPRLVAILHRWGFLWGGDFQTPDGNHFEYRRTPRSIARRG
jgi:D-alanyl-D-alanine carboxypeptidase